MTATLIDPETWSKMEKVWEKNFGKEPRVRAPEHEVAKQPTGSYLDEDKQFLKKADSPSDPSMDNVQTLVELTIEMGMEMAMNKKPMAVLLALGVYDEEEAYVLRKRLATTPRPADKFRSSPSDHVSEDEKAVLVPALVRRFGELCSEGVLSRTQYEVIEKGLSSSDLEPLEIEVYRGVGTTLKNELEKLGAECLEMVKTGKGMPMLFDSHVEDPTSVTDSQPASLALLREDRRILRAALSNALLLQTGVDLEEEARVEPEKRTRPSRSDHVEAIRADFLKAAESFDAEHISVFLGEQPIYEQLSSIQARMDGDEIDYWEFEHEVTEAFCSIAGGLRALLMSHLWRRWNENGYPFYFWTVAAHGYAVAEYEALNSQLMEVTVAGGATVQAQSDFIWTGMTGIGEIDGAFARMEALLQFSRCGGLDPDVEPLVSHLSIFQGLLKRVAILYDREKLDYPSYMGWMEGLSHHSSDLLRRLSNDQEPNGEVPRLEEFIFELVCPRVSQLKAELEEILPEQYLGPILDDREIDDQESLSRIEGEIEGQATLINELLGGPLLHPTSLSKAISFARESITSDQKDAKQEQLLTSLFFDGLFLSGKLPTKWVDLFGVRDGPGLEEEHEVHLEENPVSRKREELPAGIRFQVLSGQPYCGLCGREPPEVKLQVDHIVPLSKGGTNNIDNLQTLCSDCNLGKSNRDDTDFRR
jgi:hypothetical protein